MRRAFWALPLLLTVVAGCRPNAVWSPDGKLLALEPRGQLFTFNTESKQFRQYTRGPQITVTPTWSPDGKRIAFYHLTRKGQDTTAINLMATDVATGVSKPLVSKLPLLKPDPNAFNIGAPLELLRETLAISWKPDGTQFAYLAFEGTDTTLWVANSDGTSPRSILTGLKSAYSPAWSPDGSQIAFISVKPSENKLDAPPPGEGAPPVNPIGSASLEVVKPDGSDRKMLWDGKAEDELSPFGTPPVWSADSKSVYITVDRDKKPMQQFPERCELFSVPADGSEARSMGTIGGPSPFMSVNAAGAVYFLAPATENEMYPRIGFTPPPFQKTEMMGVLDAKLLGVPAGQQLETDSFPIPSISPDGSRFAISFAPKTGKPTLLLRSTAADGKWEKYQVPLASPTVPAKPAPKPAPKKPVKKPVRKPVRR